VLMATTCFQAFHLLVSVDSPGSWPRCRRHGAGVPGELVEIQESHNFEIDESGYLYIIAPRPRRSSPQPVRPVPSWAAAPTRYGRACGVRRRDRHAFQISDDMLDLVGSQDKTGKTAATTSRKDASPCVIFALKQAPEARRREMLKLWTTARAANTSKP